MEDMRQFCVDILQASILLEKRKFFSALYWPTSMNELFKPEALEAGERDHHCDRSMD
jgi:hypothetical protein